MSIPNKRKLDNKNAKDEDPSLKSSKCNPGISKLRSKTKKEILRCYEELYESFNLLQIEYEKLVADKEINEKVRNDLEGANKKLEDNLNNIENCFQDLSCEECGYPCHS